ncbi:MBL fold metallo-hydrolase [Rossellomorea marisflavi]|uniref:MBL fold metallo-hydrolase n=1 Tax=Rossellomorea marisflavi TaxID=189381 RepID=UPI00345AF3F8
MYFKSFFDEKLAHMSYLIGCQKTGEALVIDPARDVAPYHVTAKKEGLTISAAAETHIHADYLSGIRELAGSGGVKLYVSDEGDQEWKYQYLNDYEHELLKDGSAFYIGNVKFDVLHTPGHTPESLSFLLTDEGGGADEPMGIFTGDFLFVGDVGRPDLLEKAAGAKGTSETGAIDMFRSLKKLKDLPDHLQVWPAHGAGSACGKSLGAVPMSTLGYERKFNWALRITDEKEFVHELLTGQPEPPTYFAQMKKLNKEGPPLLKREEIPRKSAPTEGDVVVDTRDASRFSDGHLKGSLNIPYNRSFPNWAGWLLDYEQDIFLIAEEDRIGEIRKALSSIGLDQVKGYMDPEDLYGQLETYESISVEKANELITDDHYYVVDVRNGNEWEDGHIREAHHHMLGHLPEADLPQDKTLIVHCQSGARSAIGASLLQAKGHEVLNVKGGFSAWKGAGYPVE